MPESIEEKDAVIIGAGISGLGTAWRLKSSGLDVLILEKSVRAGGAILTEEEDGFLVDCGPNSTLETSPVVKKFVDDLGLQDERVYADERAKRRYVLKHGKLAALPMNPQQFLSSPLFSWTAKLRLLAEPFISAAPEDKEETVAEFVKRRLGTEFLDYAINPFVAGVYAGDPTTLSIQSAVAKIYALERDYGSLIKGALLGARARKKQDTADKTRARLFSFRKGMTQLVEALATRLGDDLLLTAELLERNPVSPWRGSSRAEERYSIAYRKSGRTYTVRTDNLIFTTPAYVTANYVRSLDPQASKALEAIVYPPVLMVFLGYRRRPECRPLDGFGFLVPEVEKRKILGNIWSSTIFPHGAPKGGIGLTVFLGGMRQPKLIHHDSKRIVRFVRDDLEEIIGLKALPDLVRIKRWNRAIPQYQIGHQELMDKTAALETSFPGIFIAGNFRDGISVGDCIINSAQVAGRVLQGSWRKRGRIAPEMP